jgi:hypothetical protein
VSAKANKAVFVEKCCFGKCKDSLERVSYLIIIIICKVNNSLSTFQNISCGIPQGSNLRPLLFTTYINYLPNSLEITEPAVFADDASLTATGESSSEIDYKLHGVEIQNVKTWLDANKLTLNE